MRLSAAALDCLNGCVERPGYDRQAQAVGIVHLGIGAFHRAHQAWYTDRAMDAGDRNWAIIGVSLRSPDVADQLNPQDGLYTVTEKSGAGDATRLIGAVRDVLVAAQHSRAVVDAIAASTTRIVSLTVTEKGYCRAADGTLDHALAGPGSLYAFLAAALRCRMETGLPGLTLLSCDNLADNGRQLARLMAAYLDRNDPALASWVVGECAFPASMIDRIVPATTATDREELRSRIGLDDAGAVVTEPFSQWVIEDNFAGPRPGWDAVGAQLVADVAPFETAKLRMLNGAHSMLAYCGLARGHTFVHEAISDPVLREQAMRLMLDEAAPTIARAPGQDLRAYARDLLDRFANPALNHRLIQIAMDGSQKIPQRWLETLDVNRQHGRASQAILAGLGAWLRHTRGANGALDDPLADRLTRMWDGNDATQVARGLFAPGGMFAGHWHPGDADIAAVVDASQG